LSPVDERRERGSCRIGHVDEPNRDAIHGDPQPLNSHDLDLEVVRCAVEVQPLLRANSVTVACTSARGCSRRSLAIGSAITG
jgi:hypothetical protein